MSDNLARVFDSAVERPHELNPAQPGTTPQRHIEIVSPSAHGRPRVIYALSAVACVGVVIVAQLLLSVGISQGAYEISALRASQVELGRTADSVSEDLIRVSSPQSLAASAESLGMVTNSNSAYLQLSDGAVLGAPSVATGSPAGAASLVPNSLLATTPLASQAVSASPAASAAPTAAAAAVVAVADGLPSPTTR